MKRLKSENSLNKSDTCSNNDYLYSKETISLLDSLLNNTPNNNNITTKYSKDKDNQSNYMTNDSIKYNNTIEGFDIWDMTQNFNRESESSIYSNYETGKKKRDISFLVVDDSIIQRKLAESKLNGIVDGNIWSVSTAENGEIALNKCSELSPLEIELKVPDVIIMDQFMNSSGGRLLGHEVVKLLRQKPGYDKVVIIGCTGSSDDTKEQFMSSGCDLVWSKPMPLKHDAINQILKLLKERRHEEIYLDNEITQPIENNDPLDNVTDNSSDSDESIDHEIFSNLSRHSDDLDGLESVDNDNEINEIEYDNNNNIENNLKNQI